MLKNKYNIGNTVWFVGDGVYPLKIKEGLVLQVKGVTQQLNCIKCMDDVFADIHYVIYPISVAENGEKYLWEEDDHKSLCEYELFLTKQEAIEYLQHQINKQ